MDEIVHHRNRLVRGDVNKNVWYARRDVGERLPGGWRCWEA